MHTQTKEKYLKKIDEKSVPHTTKLNKNKSIEKSIFANFCWLFVFIFVLLSGKKTSTSYAQNIDDFFSEFVYTDGVIWIGRPQRINDSVLLAQML